MWHRLLVFLHIRNEMDWANPDLGPEVAHPYFPDSSKNRLRCCEHCGGGKFNRIHREPYDKRRTAQILGERMRVQLQADLKARG
jgi:hypothetical protein